MVGVGSVGTRCWIFLLLGRDGQDPLFLQAKEADTSVLAEHVGASRYRNQGERVVSGQRLMQAASDIFLGWERVDGIDGKQRDFYVRQLRDWKGIAVPETMRPEGMRAFGQLCGFTLARAHARSGDRIAIASYLGKSSSFDRALATFAEAYADQNERDHQALVDAVRGSSPRRNCPRPDAGGRGPRSEVRGARVFLPGPSLPGQRCCRGKALARPPRSMAARVILAAALAPVRHGRHSGGCGRARSRAKPREAEATVFTSDTDDRAQLLAGPSVRIEKV